MSHRLDKKKAASEWMKDKLIETNFNNVAVYKMYDLFLEETNSVSNEASFQGSIRKFNRKLKNQMNIQDSVKTFPIDWIKEMLLKYEDAKTVKDLYDKYIKETGANTSKTVYYRKVDIMNSKLRTAEVKDFDKEKYTEEFLFDLLERETEKKRKKLVFTDIKRIAKENNFDSGVFYTVIPELNKELDHIYKLAMHHISDKVREIKLQNEVRILRAENKKLANNVADYDNVRDIFDQAVNEYEALEAPQVLIKGKHKKGKKKTMAIPFISDIHWGDIVDKREINGINEYSIEIAKKRIDSYFLQMQEMVEDWGLDEATYILNGDIVEGYIQPDSVRNSDIHTVSGVLSVADYLSEHIAESRKYFKKIDVYAMVGNHGRMLPGKPIQKNYVDFNLDSIAYHFMEKELKRVVKSFVIPKSIFFVVPVLDRHILVTHGHTCGGGGNGYQPIPNSISKTISKMTGLVDLSDFEHIAADNFKIDFALMGHFHIATETYSFNMTPIYVNGSPKGADQFSVQALGKASPPAQRLFYMEEGYGNHGVKFAPIIYL